MLYQLTWVLLESEVYLLLSSGQEASMHSCNGWHNCRSPFGHYQPKAAAGPQLRRILSVIMDKNLTLWPCIQRKPCSKYNNRGPAIVDLTGYEKLLGEEQRNFSSNSHQLCPVADKPKIRKLVMPKAKPETNHKFYGKGTLCVECTSRLEQLLAVSPNSVLGSKRLTLSEALTSSAKTTTDIMTTASTDSVNYCWFIFDRTHPS